MIARGVKFGKWYKLDACTIEYNSTYVKRKSMNTLLEEVRVSPSIDGHGFWAPKGTLSSESKLTGE